MTTKIGTSGSESDLGRAFKIAAALIAAVALTACAPPNAPVDPVTKAERGYVVKTCANGVIVYRDPVSNTLVIRTPGWGSHSNVQPGLTPEQVCQ